jgi:hypothetical protein
MSPLGVTNGPESEDHECPLRAISGHVCLRAQRSLSAPIFPIDCDKPGLRAPLEGKRL